MWLTGSTNGLSTFIWYGLQGVGHNIKTNVIVPVALCIALFANLAGATDVIVPNRAISTPYQDANTEFLRLKVNDGDETFTLSQMGRKPAKIKCDSACMAKCNRESRDCHNECYGMTYPNSTYDSQRDCTDNCSAQYMECTTIDLN